jgi:hypothetical protein
MTTAQLESRRPTGTSPAKASVVHSAGKGTFETS